MAMHSNSDSDDDLYELADEVAILPVADASPTLLPPEAWARREALKRTLNEAERVVALCGTASQAHGLLCEVGPELDALIEKYSGAPPVVRDGIRHATQMADVYLRLGQSKAAMQAMQRAIHRVRQLEQLPSDAASERFKARSFDKLGELALRLGDGDSARRLFKQARQLHWQRVAADPRNPEVLRDLSASNLRLGDLCARTGRYDSARQYYTHSLELRETMAAAAPCDPALQRDVSVALSKLGDACGRLGDLDAAYSFHRRTFEIHQQLVADEPDRAHGRRDLAVSLNKLGNLELKRQHVAKARECFKQWLVIAEDLAAADAESVQAQGELAYCLGCLGRLEMQVGDFETARLWLSRGVKILLQLQQQGLLDGLPVYQSWLTEQRQQLETCQADGWTVEGLNLAPGDASGTSISISRLLVPDAEGAEPPPTAPHWPQEVDHAELRSADSIPEIARPHAGTDAVSTHDAHETEERDVPILPESISACAAEADSATDEPLRRAVVDLEFALDQPPHLVGPLLAHRARCLAEQGRFDRLAETIACCCELPPVAPAHLFALAGACAAAVAWLDEHAADPTPDDRRAQRQWTQRAIRHLREAVATGFGDFDNLVGDPAWRCLRDHPSVRPLWQVTAART